MRDSNVHKIDLLLHLLDKTFN